jgi:drug/metabolite transporter (DMT)-like permease
MIFAYLIALIAGTLSGITETLNKNITEKRYSVFSYAFIQWCGALILYAVPFFLWGALPKQITAYIYLGIVITIVFLGNISLIKAYKTEDISNINILSQVSLIIAFVTGVVFLHETVNIHKILGIIFIIIGIIVIFYEGKKIQFTTAYLLSLIAGISFGLTAYFNKKALYYFNPVSLLFIYNLCETILLLFLPKTLQDVKPILQKYKWKIVVSRLAVFVGFYLLIWSIQQGSISVVNTNSQTAFLLSTVIIGILLLNEKKNIAKKLAGSLLCTFGIILLNFF